MYYKSLNHSEVKRKDYLQRVSRCPPQPSARGISHPPVCSGGGGLGVGLCLELRLRAVRSWRSLSCRAAVCLSVCNTPGVCACLPLQSPLFLTSPFQMHPPLQIPPETACGCQARSSLAEESLSVGLGRRAPPQAPGPCDSCQGGGWQPGASECMVSPVSASRSHLSASGVQQLNLMINLHHPVYW